MAVLVSPALSSVAQSRQSPFSQKLGASPKLPRSFRPGRWLTLKESSKICPVFRLSASSDNSSTATASRIDTLKKHLEESLDKTDTNLSDESLTIIAELESLNPTPQPARTELWAGPFQMLNSTQQNVLYRGAQVTLGRLSFNAFKPNDLKITMEDVYNDVKIHASDSYNFLIPFTVSQEGLPPLKGLLFNEARIIPTTENPDKRVDVEFVSATLMPRDDSVDLTEWKRVFGEVNQVDDKGVAKIALPSSKGWFELTYLDEAHRISHGMFGTIVVLKRLEAPAIPVSA